MKFAKFLGTPYFSEHLLLPVSVFQPAVLIKKEIPVRIFFCEFCKIFKNIFWQNTSGWLLLKFRSSRQVFCKNGVLKNFAKFTGKYICQSLFFNKIADMRPATLLKRGSWQRYFTKFLQAPIFIEHLWWLLL